MRIRKKFTISILFTALLPLMVSMGLALWHSTEQTTQLTLETAHGRLDSAAQKLSLFFSTRIAEVSTYSQTALLKSMDFSSIKPFLMSELNRHKNVYEKFILGTPIGHFYNTSGGNPGVDGLRTFNDQDPDAKPKHIRKRDYWQQTVGNNHSQNQVTYVSDPMISYTTGAKQIVVASSILSNDNQVKGMIGGALPWSDIKHRIEDVNNEVIKQVGLNAKFFLISHTGTYWYHWDQNKIVHLKLTTNGKPFINEIGEKVIIKTNIKDEPLSELIAAGALMMNGESGYSSFVQPETGITNYLVYSPIPSAKYSIGLIVPQDQILAPVSHLQSIFIITFIIAIVFASLIAFIVSYKVSSPIVLLNKMTKAINTGNWSMKLIPQGHDETRELTESFNVMSDTLQRREQALQTSEKRLENINAELENRISERTKELELINDSLNQQIKERSIAETSLRNSEELLSNTGHLAHVGGWKYNVLNKELNWTHETYVIHRLPSDTHVNIDIVTSYFDEQSQSVFKSSIENALNTGNAFDLELSLTKKIWVRVICNPRTENNKTVELIGAYQDISELKKVEQLKHEFVSVVSHELRTPLTSIRGSLSLLKSGNIIEIKNDSAVQMLDIAERNSERLLLLINDLLDMEKIDSGKMDYSFEAYMLSDLLNQSISENESFAKQQQISFLLEQPIPNVFINVDKERFLQVMSNLLSNAVKFTRPNTSVDISAEITDKNHVCVSIRDHGTGIPENFKDKIFTKFSQADSSDARQQNGTGLGLSICKAIIAQMHGDISYKNLPDAGAIFYFSLPIVKAAD